jgi:transposase
MQTVADRIAKHLAQIHAALRHRVSNARTEAFNTRLQMINRRAYGFHSAEALIALAMLDLGRLCPPLPGRS